MLTEVMTDSGKVGVNQRKPDLRHRLRFAERDTAMVHRQLNTTVS